VLLARQQRVHLLLLRRLVAVQLVLQHCGAGGGGRTAEVSSGGDAALARAARGGCGCGHP
jgi:hypothetical protein